MAKIVEIGSQSNPDVNLTPVQYTWGQLYETEENHVKYCINVDYFTAVLSGGWLRFDEQGEPLEQMEFDDGILVLVRDDGTRRHGTKWFKYSYDVVLHGEPIGYILTHPRSSHTGGENSGMLSQFHLNNPMLYRRGWIDIFQYVMKTTGTHLNNITRLDIALDGRGFLDLMGRVRAGKIRATGRGWQERIHGAFSGPINKVRIGSTKSDKYGRCYNKTLEIKEKSPHKTYIPKYWEKAGMDTSKDVERLELTLTNKALKQVKDLDINRLDNPEYLAGLMRAFFRNWFEFVETSGDTNVSRKEKIQPVDWSYFDGLVEIEKQSKVNAPSVIWAVQQAIRFEMLEYYAKADKASDLFNQTFAKCYQRAKDYGLLDWFKDKMKRWEQKHEFHQAIRDKRNEARKRRIGAWMSGIVNPGGTLHPQVFSH